MLRQKFIKDWMWGKAGCEKQLTDLPHDAMQYENRSADSLGGGGGAYYEGGCYEYEKRFVAPEDWKDKHVELQFEGVYCNSIVYINGKEAGQCAYGYVPFFVDLDESLIYGEENTILVKVNNDQLPNTRWYSGSGIYRPVWLWIGEKAHIQAEGVQIRTVEINPALVEVKTEAVGEYDEIVVQIQDEGRVLQEAKGSVCQLPLAEATLWSEDHPKLYTCVVSLYKAGEIIDQTIEKFGIRKVEWNNTGLYVNGKNTLLRGGCVHHDNGVVGARSYGESEWRRVEILKKSGFNAIRVSHNPASSEMLAACDYYGMYVMDETWDMWYKHKNKHDYATYFMDNYVQDIQAMVKRDYNHPSVIMYSIGNEVSEPATEKGIHLAKDIIERFHELDPDRPVTGGMNLMIISRSAKGNDIYKEEGGRDESDDEKASGMNSMMFNVMTSMVGSGMNKGANGKEADRVTSPVLDALDMAGYNYASGRYPLEGKAHSNRVIFGSETFPQDIAKNWAMVKKYPYLIGDFMWTSWDYIGETGAGAWAYTKDGAGFEKPFPWLLADMGVIDILGNPNGELYFANAAWEQLTTPVICVQPINHPGVKPFKSSWRGTNALPTWSWKDCEGNKAVVEVYVNADKVTLYKNDKKVGTKKCKDGKATFKTKYEAGTLRAIAYKQGKTVESSLTSAASTLKITADVEAKRCVNDNVFYVNVSMADKDGIVEANADTRLNVSIENGKLLGFGSANPRTVESFVEKSYTTYYGRSQAIVEVNKGETAVLTISADGFEDSAVKIVNE